MKVYTPAELAERIQKTHVENPEAMNAASLLIRNFVSEYQMLLMTIEAMEGRDVADSIAVAVTSCMVGSFKDTARCLETDHHDLFVALDEAVKLLPEPGPTTH